MGRRGFTLIELLVVMAIMGMLLAIAAPKYFESVQRAKETALRTDLRVLREAIDRFHSDTRQYPSTLETLAKARYLKAVPVDPMTESAGTWVLHPHPDGQTAGIYDVSSGAPGGARNGSSYATW